MDISNLSSSVPYILLLFLVVGGTALAGWVKSFLRDRRDRMYSVSPAPVQLSNISDEALALLDQKVRPTTVSPLQEQLTPQPSGSAGVPPPAPNRRTSGEIFLSYASEDGKTAQMLVQALERMGRSVWWDRDIPPGESYHRVIEEKLASSKCVIVLWSLASVKSDYVKNEASEGTERNILVPAKIEEVKFPLGFKHLQAVDLIGWRGSSPHAGFDSLVNRVTSILESGNT